MIKIYRSWSSSSAFSLHSSMSHTTIAVKNVLKAYTSASTALNQWLSVNAKVSAPTAAPPKPTNPSPIVMICPRQWVTTFTIIRYNSITANALAKGDMTFTRKAISSLIGSIEKIRPKRRKKGLPGGCGTPNVCETAMNSPQSQ